MASDDTPATKDARLDTALKRFKFGSSAESAQRQRELAALRFFAGDQWPDYIRSARNGEQVPNANGNVDTVGRKPCLTINKVKQPISQIVNQIKGSDLGIILRAEKNASLEDAKLRQGLIRHIQAHSNARVARNWAAERAAEVGRGYYRIDKQYVYKTRDVLKEDPSVLMDQDLVVSRILNQGNVLLDPFAKQPDWSDGEWAFVWDDMRFDDFKRKYKKSKTAALIADVDGKTLTAVAEQAPGWIGGEEEARTVRVAEYWYASYDPVTVRVMQMPDGTSQLTDQPVKDWPTGATQGSGELYIEDRHIDWCKITATEILEETSWEGRHIPIIPVIGNEYNLNGERLWNGEVEDAMDAQRLFNYTASAIALATALAPLAPFILDPRQIETYESWWKQANTRNFPYLPAHAFDERGQPYPPIQRQSSEPPIQALGLMLNQADSYIQATTSTPDTSLGRFDPKKASGKAVGLLQAQSDLANSNYLDNLAHISMTLEGTILNEMLQYVYDRPGRIVQILGDDGKPQQSMVNAPFVKNQQGVPQPAPQPTQGQPDVQEFDLSKGTYSIIVDVIKNAETERKETQANLTEMMSTSPQVSSALAPLVMKYSDQAGSQEAFDVMKKLLWPPDLQSDGQNVNWEGQAKQAAQQIQQMAQLLHQQQQMIDTKKIEHETEISVAKINAMTRVKVAQIQAASAGEVAETKVNQASAEAVFQSEIDAAGLTQEHAHEAIQGHLDRQHALTEQATQHGHEQDLAAQQAQQQEADRQMAAKQDAQQQTQE